MPESETAHSPSAFFAGNFPSLLETLEDHFDRMRQSIEAGPGGKVEALILGGGYGRGEGGVWNADSDQPELYDDLNYFLFTDTPRDPDILQWIDKEARSEGARLRVMIQITPLARAALGDPSLSMPYFDLVAGHAVVHGPGDFLTPLQKGLDPERILPVNATELLWNRGSGLYFARCELETEDGDINSAWRSIQKVKLALGDAWLCLNGLHHHLAQTRLRRLAAIDMPMKERVLMYHAEGTSFKTQPKPPPVAKRDLFRDCQELSETWKHLWLEVESIRLGESFRSLRDYASYGKRLFPESSAFANFGKALGDRFGQGASLRPTWDDPRGALFRALSLLNSSSAEALPLVGQYLPNRGEERTTAKAWCPVYREWYQRLRT